ncbi:unnamed protein product, partial [Laminaria digitata]
MAARATILSLVAGVVLQAHHAACFSTIALPSAARARSHAAGSASTSAAVTAAAAAGAVAPATSPRQVGAHTRWTNRAAHCSNGVAPMTAGTRSWTASLLRLQAVEEPTAAEREPDAIDLDIETQVEAERIMAQLESENERQDAVPDDGSPKYMPSTEDSDPIVRALKAVLKCKEVTAWELLDSRWNGNEAFRWTTDKGPFFVKLNRVEDISVFMTEAVSLSALAKADVMQVPKPLHLGKLPKVGDIGPGAFMILEHLALVPFGPMRPGNQAALGNSLADLHLSTKHDELHQGRFGFPVSNFLALTPLNNAWCSTWTEFFERRMSDQIEGLLKDKAYGRAALVAGEEDTEDVMRRFRVVQEKVGEILEGVDAKPALLPGDLWIG